MRYLRCALAVRLLSPVVSGFLWYLLVTAATAQFRDPDAPYVPTPEGVVQEMLDIARVAPADIVYDLGSGDGRIVIAAAVRFGARGVGIEIDPELVRQAADYAERGGVAHLVRFVEGDFFAVDLREATVVTLYLLPEVNRRLLPKLLAELRPGTRIVSYKYPLGDWPPNETVRVSRGTVYVWVVPRATPGR
jgi:SAM-dependent methyltransferase